METTTVRLAAGSDRVLVACCEWRTFRRKDGSTYRKKIQDCGSSNCIYSSNYIPKT